MNKEKNKLFFCFLVIYIFKSTFLPAQEEENLKRALQFLAGPPGNNLILQERPLLADYGGFGSSLFVSNRFIDTGEQNGTFVLAVPLGAEFAVDTALALAEMLKDSSVNILIGFLGEEKNELPKDMGGITHKGLRALLSLADMPENWVLCYFDAMEPPEKLVISHAVSGYVTPLDLITPLPSLFTLRGIPWSFKTHQNTIYIFGLAEGPEALSVIWGEEVNGFVLSGVPDNGEAILPGYMAELFLEYANALDFPVLNPEKHYSFIAFPGGRIFFISELTMVILVMLTVGLLLFFYMIFSLQHNAVLLFHIRLFFKYLLVFILLISLLIISIKISGFLYSLFLSVFTTQSGTSNQAGLTLTMLLALLLFSLSSQILDIVRFPLRERFFKFASVIFIVFGIITAILMDFSYVSIFLVFFAFFFIGAIIPNPIFVFFVALSLPVIALIALSSIFVTDNERLTELFITSFNTLDSWIITFQISLLFLPVFLLGKRGIMLSRAFLRRKPKLKRKKKLLIIPALITAVVLLMIVQIIMPRNELSPERRFISEADGADSILTLLVDDTRFQSSRIITMNLAARGNPRRFDVSLLSETERILLPLYSAPVPFEREDGGKRINFFLGENPPNPLTIEIVIPLEFDGRLEAAAIYNNWDPAIDPEEKPVSENYILRASKSTHL